MQKELALLRLRLTAAGENAVAPCEPRLALLRFRLERVTDTAMTRRAEQIRRLHTRLEAINPTGVLQRGYALVTAEDGLITSAESAEKHDRMRLVFRDGSVSVRRDKEA